MLLRNALAALAIFRCLPMISQGSRRTSPRRQPGCAGVREISGRASAGDGCGVRRTGVGPAEPVAGRRRPRPRRHCATKSLFGRRGSLARRSFARWLSGCACTVRPCDGLAERRIGAEASGSLSSVNRASALELTGSRPDPSPAPSSSTSRDAWCHVLLDAARAAVLLAPRARARGGGFVRPFCCP